MAVGFRRDKDIPRLINRIPNSLGLMGSDAWLEIVPTLSKPLAASVIGRLAARFVVGARQEEAAEMSQRLASGEELNWATSNPRQLEVNAQRYGYGMGDVFCLNGSVEAALDDDPELDVVFDIVDTGKSMRASNLEIIHDNVAGIALIGICQQSAISRK